ncbi:MAG: DUF6297 family protein [Acidimicrobiia bacterium]
MTVATVTVSTTDVLAWLRRTRGQRRRKLGKAVYGAYVAALVIVLYGYPVFDWVRRTLGGTELRADTGPVVVRSLVPALAGLVLVALGVFVRNARWRGPVVLGAADVGWLLPLPLDRGRVLRPRLFVTAGVTAIAGGILGLLGAAVLHALRPATGIALVVVLAVSSALVGVLGVSVALLVEASPRLERLAQRWSAVPLVVGAALVAVAAVSASSGSRPGWIDDAVTWSGPWGWVAYPISTAARADSLGTGAAVALGVLAALTLAAALGAAHACGSIPTQSLRVRARTAQSVGAAVFMGDARQARLSIRASRAQAGGAKTRVRLPRSPHLVVMWRDLTGVVRGPGQLGWTATFAFSSIGIIAAGTAASTDGTPPILLVVVAVLLAYGAASSLVETARLDGDTPQIASQLPVKFSGIAVRHAVVPSLFLAAIGAVAWAIGVALEPGLGWSGMVAVVLCAPPLVAAALFNAYKGRLPLELVVSIGDAGVFILAGWYIVGPAAALAVLTPVIVQAFDAAKDNAGVGPMLADIGVATVATTTAGLMAVAARAGHRVAPPREGGLLGLAKKG